MNETTQPQQQPQQPQPKAKASETLEMKASDVTVKIRRSPKFTPFVIAGMAVGIIAAFVVNALIADENRTPAAILGYLVLYFAGAGLGLAVVTVIVLDRISLARAKQVSATKLER